MEESTSMRQYGSHNYMVVKIVGILAFATVLGLAVVKDSIWNQSYDSVQVIGRGHIPVVPDAAIINLGVLTIRESTSDLAIQKTSEALKHIDVALEQAGIPRENRQITGYVLNPRYKEMPNTPEGEVRAPEIDGYTSSQQITVLVSGVKDNSNRVSEIVSIATKAGANQVGEVKMVATNAEELKQKARLEAVADATKKAKDMASVSGLKLKNISSWYESILAAPGSQNEQSINNALPPNQYPAPSSIIVLQPGQLEIVVELNVSFRVKN
jgi:uncharacterized protein YggE